MGPQWVAQADSQPLYNGTLMSAAADTSQLCWHACISTPRCRAWCAWFACHCGSITFPLFSTQCCVRDKVTMTTARTCRLYP